MRPHESYWTCKAPPTPELHDLPQGTFAGTEAGFNSLSPGMRREIYRSAVKRAAKVSEDDAERLSRADDKQALSEVQIKAREAL